MSCKNVKKKTTSGSGFNLNSISSVINVILAAFDIPEEPLIPLPPPLLLVGAKLRTGLSASKIAANIISRQSEAGLVVGNIFGDGPNTGEALLAIIAEEFISAIHTDAKVEIVIPPGIAVSTIGTSPLGPVVSVGATTIMGIGDGVMR